MISNLIIKYLRQCGTRFDDRIVGTAEYISDDDITALPPPYLFVVPTSEQVVNAGNVGSFDVVQSIALIAALDVSEDPRGQKSIAEFCEIRRELSSCLVGWIPDRCWSAGYYLSGAVADSTQSRAFYQFNFAWKEAGLDPDEVGVSLERQQEWDRRQNNGDATIINNISLG